MVDISPDMVILIRAAQAGGATRSGNVIVPPDLQDWAREVYQVFLDKIIETGMEAARVDYCKPKAANKLRGSLAGFEACRGKSLQEIGALLAEARAQEIAARGGDNERYWELVCRSREIEWTANVLSAILMSSGQPTIVPPTCRGVLHAHRLLGGVSP